MPESSIPPSAALDAQGSGPFSFNQVLLEELRKLRPEDESLNAMQAEGIDDPDDPKATEFTRGQNLHEIFQHISTLNGNDRLSALCLSGGGIRSATFNLGVIQGLARLRLLDHFDYLSTVSGGGYIGGWLKAWMRRDGTARVLNDLNNTVPDLPLKPEPRPIDRLREYSNYLTPRPGLFSGDTWTAAALVTRNLLLNWLVFVPILMATIAAPQAYYLALRFEAGARYATAALVLALALSLFAAIAIHRFRHPLGGPGTQQRTIVLFGVVPLVMSALLLSLDAAWRDAASTSAAQLNAFAALWCVAIPMMGWSLHEPFWLFGRERRLGIRELFALVLSGAFAAVAFVWLGRFAYPALDRRPILFALSAVPILLLLYLFARSIFVGLAESFPRSAAPAPAAGQREDADREWWARLSGYILLIAVGWIAVNAIALLAWHYVLELTNNYVTEAMSGVGVVSGIAALVLGKSADTSSAGQAGKAPGPRWKVWALRLAAPVFCMVIILLLAHLNVLLARVLTGKAALFTVPASLLDLETAPVSIGELRMFVTMALALLLFGLIMGRFVNVNRFSLHGLYRNRLVRAYLGASNPKREPDPFTGFALNDNLKMRDLWKPAAHPDDTESRKPLLVVNTTLNLLRGAKLAWQERKAESFSISPFFCGNFYEGYRRSGQYGGPGGITLGTALTISGAAANPNMGHHSSPPITFLLSLLNGRLGAWLGNTNGRGEKTFRNQGPRWAVGPLFTELFGLTTNATKYVQLSDGGHFENLGIYEMVLRRCRFIVVCDAGRDPGSGFEDLGNAIRKIRIDFGVSIDFERPIEIMPRSEKEEGMYCAAGTIRYSDIDGTNAAPGTIIYLKPTLRARGAALPYDVFSYSRKADDFPHESTADQWFDESQFESYRALGRHLIDQITSRAETPIQSLQDFHAAVQRYLDAAEWFPHQTSRSSPSPSPLSLALALDTPAVGGP